jgi:hypothetical protein
MFQALDVFIRNGTQSRCPERWHKMHVKDRLLRRDLAGLLAVRNGMALNESTGKLFECARTRMGDDPETMWSTDGDSPTRWGTSASWVPRSWAPAEPATRR